MGNTTGVFGIDVTTSGVRIIPVKSFITNAAMSDAELDIEIALAKTDLDLAAKEAREAIRNHPLKSS